MIDYCNRTGTSPWFCIPRRADDNYIRKFAEMVRDSLDPALLCYVEYSNEIWNSIFDQTRYCESLGMVLKLGDTLLLWDSGWRYSGRRPGQRFLCTGP